MTDVTAAEPPAPPPIRWSHVVIDCRDADALAAFYAALVEGEVQGRFEQYVLIRGSRAGAPKMMFQEVPEDRVGKNRVHLDFDVTDLDAAVARAEALGATRSQEQTMSPMRWWVMTDPEGNEFCLCKADEG